MEAHSCKFCKRVFPNGRSLGGHIRSHVMIKSSYSSKKSQAMRDSWTAGFDEDQEEEMEGQTEYKGGRNKRLERRLKLVEAISVSSSPATCSPEYGALCLMMLSRGAGFVLDKNEVKKSESDVLRIGIKKVDYFPSESEFNLEDDEAESNKDENFAAAPESGKRRRSSRNDFEAGTENSTKRSKYECTICNKSFHSYQALGGHCASHKKIRTDSSSVSAVVAEHHISQKLRVHECPICEKVFSSGQALGGHKRSHLTSGNSTALAAASSTEITEIEQKNSKLNSLDLNLPASDFENCDSSDSSRNNAEGEFTAFQESCRLAAFMM